MRALILKMRYTPMKMPKGRAKSEMTSSGGFPIITGAGERLHKPRKESDSAVAAQPKSTNPSVAQAITNRGD